jgi:serine/threonine-protein kinase
VAAQTEPEVDVEGSTDHDERLGQVVADRYRIVRVLGVGGMGGVYEAEHLLIGKKVALKCLHREYARDRDIVERFKREARAATLIGNDHIIDVTDMGDLPDGAPFLVMEYLAGKPLAAVCEQGPMPIKRAVHVARQICSALGAAHEKGIVHRDLKPENCFLIERNGDPDFVKVLDFGISKMHSSGVDKGLTRTGMAMGTPSYMSPEQAQGSKNVDHRTDIWALGVILYEMLAARRPFDADSYPMLLMNIVATDPDPVAWYRKDLPPALADAVMKCLVKDQTQRVSTMRELAELLAPFEGLDVSPELQTPGEEAAGQRESATERFKATAASRKKAPPTEADPAEERRSSGTQPDGSLDGPPAVSLAQAEAEATARKAAREAVPSEPRSAEAAARVPAPTAPEVRALESKARSGSSNTTTVAVAIMAIVAVAGIGIAAASGAFSTSPPAPPPTAATPPGTSTEAPDPPPRDPDPVRVETPPQVVQAPPAEVRIRIRADPADARILIAGVEFPNPMDAPQPRSLTPTQIRIERDGYRTIEQLAIFGEDQSFMFQMARGRGVEQRPMAGGGSGGGGGGGSGGTAEPATMSTSMATMEVYEGSQGGFREEW